MHCRLWLKAVFSESKLHCTAAVRQAQVPRVIFVSDRMLNKDIDARIEKKQFFVRFAPAVKTREPSNTEKLSVLKSVFVRILTYVREF